MIHIHPTAKVSPHARCYAEHLIVGPHTRIDDGAIITGEVRLGAYVHIAAYVLLLGRHSITIGDYTGIGAFCAVLSGCDDFSGRSMCNPTIPNEYKPHLKEAPVRIGKNVLIGAHTSIMPGVTVNDGAAIGGQSLVSTDCAAQMIYGGVPAKVLKERRNEMWKLTERFERKRLL